MIALGDVAVVERVASVLATLGDPHACDDTEALLAQVPLPADLTARAEVERLERQRLRAEALAKAGHPRTALTQLAELHDEASRIDHPPLAGRIALTQAHALAEDGRWGEAIPMAKTVAWQAHAAHDDVLECEASVLVLVSLAPSGASTRSRTGRRTPAPMWRDARHHRGLAAAVAGDHGGEPRSHSRGLRRRAARLPRGAAAVRAAATDRRLRRSGLAPGRRRRGIGRPARGVAAARAGAGAAA
ncbi:MAG: hypothetical protein U0168_03640 [Nannocystaceae bacterium]